MTFNFKVGQKIWLKSCDSCVRDIHPHIWRLDPSTRSTTILDPSYSEPNSGKVFVCLALDNPINNEPSPTELRYILNEKSHKVLPEFSRLMLIERRIFQDNTVQFVWRNEDNEVWREPDSSGLSIMQETENVIDDASIELLSNVLGLTRPDAKKLFGVFGSVEDALDNYDAYMESEDALLSSELANVFSSLPDAPSHANSTSTSNDSALPPPPPSTLTPPVKPEKPSRFGGLLGLSKKRPHSTPPPPPPVVPVDDHQDEINQLVGILSVTAKVAKGLLDKHKQDVTEAITHYFGLSTREQAALETSTSSSHMVASSLSKSSDLEEGEEWDSFESFLLDSDSRGHGARGRRGDEQPIMCKECQKAVHYLPPNLYKRGWKCDWPAHQGPNLFLATVGFYCCSNLLYCDYMVCEQCFLRDSHDFSSEDGTEFAQLKKQLGGETKKGCSTSSENGSTVNSGSETDLLTLANACWSPADSDDSSSYFQTTPSTRDSLYSSHAFSSKNSSLSTATPIPTVPVISLPEAVKVTANCSVCKKPHKSDDLTCLWTCKHSVCSACLSKHLVASRTSRPDPTAVHHPKGVKIAAVKSLFVFNALPTLPVPPLFESFTLPSLRTDIRCPVSSCKHCLVEMDIQNQTPYSEDWQQSQQQAAACVSEMRAYQTCCMAGVVCEDGPQPVSHFIQLGCDHFFHYDCLAPALRTRIEKERVKTKPQVIVCPKCEESKSSASCCYCMTCAGNKRKHVVNDQEIRGLVECTSCDFTERDKQNWLSCSFLAFSEALSAQQLQHSALNGVEDSDYDDCGEERLVPVTCVCGVLYFTDADSTHVTCTNEACLLVICVKCMKRAHFRQTCAEAAASQTPFNESTLDLAGLGIILQYCPFCGTPGDRPKDCLHITCVCSEQFCFLCAAPYTPAYAHSTAYHRPQCSLHEVCCDEQCFDKGQSVCRTDKYQPGPCGVCKNTVNHNTCTHSANWKACKKCLDKHIHCSHWCCECAKLGKLCSPPGNPTTPGGQLRFKIITHEAVKRAENDEISGRKKTEKGSK